MVNIDLSITLAEISLLMSIGRADIYSLTGKQDGRVAKVSSNSGLHIIDMVPC